MFLQHDRWTILNVPDSGDLNDPYPYSHGYISRDCEWITIMAYPHKCGSPTRLNRFSNPNQEWKGEPMGVRGSAASPEVDGPADAVRSLNEKRWEVESYWVPRSDRAVLDVLYNTTGGDQWYFYDPVRDFVFDSHDRVTHVYLDGTRIRGPLTSTLGS